MSVTLFISEHIIIALPDTIPKKVSVPPREKPQGKRERKHVSKGDNLRGDETTT